MVKIDRIREKKYKIAHWFGVLSWPVFWIISGYIFSEPSQYGIVGILVGIVGLVAPITVMTLAHRSFDKCFLERFVGRKSLSDDTIFAEFYASDRLQKIAVLKAWHDFAESCGIPAGKIRPKDRLDREFFIEFQSFKSDHFDELCFRAEAYESCPDREALLAVRSVDDFVRLVAA